MSKVTILMSTFNGEKYLREQIESILSQVDVDYSILVRDDGSEDSTMDILSEYQMKGKLIWYSGINVGWRMSFMDLLHRSPKSDYYAFCDQDDIWLPHKLIRAVQCLDQINHSVKLYCSNLFYYDGVSQGRPIKPLNPLYNKYTCLSSNLATGNTIVFDNGLLEIIRSFPPEHVIAHDFWLYQTAMFLGHVYYDQEAFILYRQHTLNQIGVPENWKEKWKSRIYNIMKYDGNHDRVISAQMLLKCYASMLSSEDKQVISIYASYRNSIKDKLKLLLSCKYIIGNNIISNIGLKFRLLLNMV